MFQNRSPGARRHRRSVSRGGRALRVPAGLAALALLSACAGGGGRSAQTAAGPTTNYYIAHAEGNYTPPGPPGDPWGPYIQLAAARFDVPARWIRQVMHVESGGHEYIDGQLTVSGAGAMGLMQVEPETYQEMAARYGLGGDPFNPYDNIMAGTAYIHEMYEVYGSPGFLAAYNAGPGRLDSFMNYSRPLPDATDNYIAMIAPAIQGYYPAHRSEADQLALNTEPMGTSTGILPPGYNPDAPAAANTIEVAYAAPRTAPAVAEVAYNPPPAPRVPAPAPQPAAVQVAAITEPAATAETAIYSPQTALAEPNPPAPPAAPTAATVQPASLQTAPVPSAPIEAVAVPAPIQTAAYQPPAQPAWQAPARAAPAHHFSLIQPAMADTLPATPPEEPAAAGRGGWAIQVGAYGNRENAKAALGIAELSAVRLLMHGEPMVVSYAAPTGMKYRARITHLAHEDALDACQRLATGPTGCEVLSPEVQF